MHDTIRMDTLGSARGLRAGFGVPPKQFFLATSLPSTSKPCTKGSRSRGCDRQHASRVRSPEYFAPLQSPRHKRISPLHWSFQIFREHELGSARFQNIIDPIKSVFHQIQAEPARFDHIMGTASHLVRRDLLTVIAQTHSNTFAQAFHRQGDELIVAQLISMANDVGAGFIDSEDHQHSLFFGERISVEKVSHETAHQGEISGVAAELDLLFFHRAFGELNRRWHSIKSGTANSYEIDIVLRRWIEQSLVRLR